jgi:hypothetical protein
MAQEAKGYSRHTLSANFSGQILDAVVEQHLGRAGWYRRRLMMALLPEQFVSGVAKGGTHTLRVFRTQIIRSSMLAFH